MYNPTYLKAILIYVKDKETGYIHTVGTDQHDRLYLDNDGNIQYMNLQNGGTTEGDYEFVLDEQGHNQSNLTFTKCLQNKCVAYKFGKCLKYNNYTEYGDKFEPKEVIEHNGCMGCVYEDFEEFEEPCAYCKGTYKYNTMAYLKAKDCYVRKVDKRKE